MAFTRVLGPGIHTASNINSHNINSTGIITAVSFVGNGAGLTGIASTDNIITGTAATFNTYPVDINAGMDVVGVSSFQDIDVDGHTNLDNVSIAGITTVALNQELVFGSNADSQLTGRIKQLSGSSPSMQITSRYPRINALDFRIHNISNNQHYAYFWSNEVALFHNGNKKFSTTGGGIDVTGNTVADGLVIDGNSDLNGDLDVDGHTNLDNVSIAGVTTFSDDITFTGQNYNVAWSKAASHIKFNDGAKAVFGTGSDLAIYHDGSNSWIKNITGNITINSNTFHLKDAANNNNYIRTYQNDRLEIYHNGGERFRTLSTGVRITGTAVAGGLDISGDIDVDGHSNLDNVSIAGVTTFSGGISGTTANLTGALTGTTANFSGNVTVGGVLTYEDVKNVDSIGIATARAGLNVSGGNVTIANDLDVDGHTNLDNVSIAGVTTTTGHIRIDADNKKLFVGADSDIQIYNNGSNSYLQNINGQLIIKSPILAIQSSSHNQIIVRDGAEVELFYKGAMKLETASSGISVVGTTTSTQLAITGVSTFTGAIDANGDLDVDGHTNLDNVSVAGVSTFSDTVRVGTGITFEPNGQANFVGVATFNNPRNSIGIHLPTNKMLVLGSNYLYGNISNTGAQLRFQALNTYSFECWDGGGMSKWLGVTGPGGVIQIGGYHMGVSGTNRTPSVQLNASSHLVRMYSSAPNSTTTTERFRLSQSGFNFTGLSTHTGNFDLDGDLDVDGHTNLDNVSIAGVTTHNEDVWFKSATSNRDVYWDKSDDSLEFYDHAKATFGTNSKTSIYHSGTQFYINNTQGNIYLRNNNENGVLIVPNSEVKLYYDGIQKLNTAEKGIQVGTGVTVETNGQATFTGIVTATSFKLANGSDVGTGAGGTWSTYTAGIATSKSVGVNTSTLDDNDLVGVGNSFQGLYISNGMIIHDNTLSGNHYIGTAFNGLMAGPVNIEGTLSVDGSYVVV